MMLKTRARLLHVPHSQPVVHRSRSRDTNWRQSAAAKELMSSTPPKTIQDQVSSVKNIRDLAEVNPILKPGRVFRCACPSNISEEDQAVLRNKLGITVLIDLRATEEQLDDGAGRKLWDGARFVRYSRSLFNCQKLNGEVLDSGTPQLTLHHISILERLRFMTGLLYKLPPLSLVSALSQLIFSYSQGKAALLRAMNDRGLGLVYEILLDTAQPEIVATLRVVSKALKEGQPVMFFCRAGKDRTGMIAMLILSVCGVGKGEIVEDYHRSDSANIIALAGIEKEAELADLDKSKFKGAPKEAMLDALAYVERCYGGPLAYLNTIGFTFEEQAQLRKLMTS